VIRFRHEDDEKRYLHLRTEIYLRVARGLPAQLVSEVMRNFGKLEQLLQLEGVRQGLAVAELSQLSAEIGAPDVRDLKAFQAHAMMYGSQDTPLIGVEAEWVDKLSLNDSDAQRAWLDPSPMRYAPQTLSEWEAVEERLVSRVEQSTRSRGPDDFQALLDGDDDGDDDGDMSDVALQSLFEGAPQTDPDDAQEQPAMLDKLRDEVLLMRSKGWDPKTWTQLIMDLHLALQTDAAFLDIQLSTQMGANVLAQAGIHISPGAGIFLEEIRSAAAAQQEEAEADDSGTPQDGGTHPRG
jgi:hypothetical protein